MLRNYFLLTIRTLLRNKTVSSINIFGLSLGLIGFILISLYVHNEKQFDLHHHDVDRIYRLALGRIDGQYSYAITGAAMAPPLQKTYPGFKAFARFRKFPSLVSYQDKAFYEDEFYFTDSAVFDVFTLDLIAGDEKALTQPNSIVITEQAAMKFFGGLNNVVGQVLSIDNQLSYQVTGIVKSWPINSHFQFDYLASIASIPTHHNEPLRTYQMTSWYAHYFYTYFRLEPGMDAHALSEQIRDSPKHLSNPEYYELYGTSMGLFLQPMSEIHLDPLGGEIGPQGDESILSILQSVSIVILALGAFNYMNLSLAQSIKRAKEVGLRKTLGAERKQLVMQFLFESVLLTLLSLAISLTTIQLSLPFVNQMLDTAMALWSVDNLYLLITIFSAAFITGVIGGFYPALVISGFRPSIIFRNHHSGRNKIGLRKLIVLIQAVASMILLALTILMFQQVAFMKNAELGITTEQVLVIPTNGNQSIHSEYEAFKNLVKTLPSVEAITINELSPGDNFGGIVATFEGMEEGESFPTTGVGFDYLKTFGLNIKAGRDFNQSIATDTIERVIINETLCSELGWSLEETVGKTYDFGADGITPGRVIGVVEDFHFASLRRSIIPIAITIREAFYDKISIRLATADYQDALAQIEELWLEQYPEWPFDYYFADDHFNRQYQSEEKFGKLFLAFALMAITIGIIGLVGMVITSTGYRLKEIGIRKALGARAFHIIKILSKEYLILMAIALALSFPIAIWLSKDWLADFAYQLENYIVPVLIGPAIVIALAITTLTLQSLKASFINPVEVLRNE
ncbi:MAG: ABC transporter permease [Cyclobacteriaceae bacterium]